MPIKKDIIDYIIENLLNHAEKEDKIFFPFVRKKLNKKQFFEIKRRISK